MYNNTTQFITTQHNATQCNNNPTAPPSCPRHSLRAIISAPSTSRNHTRYIHFAPSHPRHLLHAILPAPSPSRYLVAPELSFSLHLSRNNNQSKKNNNVCVCTCKTTTKTITDSLGPCAPSSALRPPCADIECGCVWWLTTAPPCSHLRWAKCPSRI